MNRFVHLGLCCLAVGLTVAGASSSLARDVLIVQSSANQSYGEAVEGFARAFAGAAGTIGIASIQPAEVVVLDSGNMDKQRILTQKYQSLQPNLIVAVGSSALQSASAVSGPVVYLMVPNPDAVARQRPATTGVRMTVDPARQLAAIEKTFPAVNRIGLLHNPASSADFLAATQAGAVVAGLTPVDIPAASDREAVRAVSDRAGAIDALLLTPDLSLISPTLLDSLALFSLEQKVPLVAFAPKYLQQGAALAVFASPEAMGRQAGRMAREILNGSRRPDAPPEYAEEASTLTNPRIMQQLGIANSPPNDNNGTVSP